MLAERSWALAICLASCLGCLGGCLVGCGVETYREAPPDPSLSMHFVAEGDAPIGMSLPRYDDGELIPLEASALIEASHIDHVQLYETGEGERLVVIDLNDIGRERLREGTTARVGARLAIIAGGHVIAAPVIREPLTEGEAYVRVPLARIESVWAALGESPTE